MQPLTLGRCVIARRTKRTRGSNSTLPRVSNFAHVAVDAPSCLAAKASKERERKRDTADRFVIHEFARANLSRFNEEAATVISRKAFSNARRVSYSGNTRGQNENRTLFIPRGTLRQARARARQKDYLHRTLPKKPTALTRAHAPSPLAPQYEAQRRCIKYLPGRLFPAERVRLWPRLIRYRHVINSETGC